MAQYATAAQMRASFPERDLAQLTDPAGKVISDAKLDQVIQNASDEIDGYLAGRYTLPLVAPPPTLATHAMNIAMYRLSAGRSAEAVEEFRNRFKDAERWLTNVATGKVVIDTNGAAPGEGTVKAAPLAPPSSASTPIEFFF